MGSQCRHVILPILNHPHIYGSIFGAVPAGPWPVWGTFRQATAGDTPPGCWLFVYRLPGGGRELPALAAATLSVELPAGANWFHRQGRCCQGARPRHRPREVPTGSRRSPGRRRRLGLRTGANLQQAVEAFGEGKWRRAMRRVLADA